MEYICGSQLGYLGLERCNYCLTQSCCPEFDACTSNPACYACLMGTGTGCDQNALHASFLACRDGTCGKPDACGFTLTP
jgi:hypothetical protein